MNFKELLATQKRVFGFLWPYWKVAVAALFFTVVVALLRLSQAKFIKWLFDLMNVDGSASTQAAPSVPVDQLDTVKKLSGYLPDFQVVDHSGLKPLFLNKKLLNKKCQICTFEDKLT